jgi:hypothetical protein
MTASRPKTQFSKFSSCRTVIRLWSFSNLKKMSQNEFWLKNTYTRIYEKLNFFKRNLGLPISKEPLRGQEMKWRYGRRKRKNEARNMEEPGRGMKEERG